MTESSEAEKLIKEIYFNRVSGFGSIADTTRQAKEKDVSITYNLVRDILNKLKHRQTHFKPTKHNTFISMGPKYEIEIDVMDMTSKAGKYRYALIGVDNFTKETQVVPIQNRTPADIVDALEEIVKKIGAPKQIYSDQEGSFTSTALIRFMNKHGIKHITTVGKAHTVERFIQTFKNNITTRLQALNEPLDKWTTHIEEIVNKYNNTKHTTTGLSPNDAKKPDNELFVRYNIFAKAKTDRKYPELKPNDKVRVMLVKDNKTKGYHPTYSDEIYTITFVKDNEYLINNNRRKVYKRFELLKVG